MNFPQKEKSTAEDLVSIVEILRAPGGCPWDREQTHASIRKNLLEETYEAVEAIDTGDAELLKEELGDVLLQVVFHAQLEREQGSFDFDDVCDGVVRKMILRHPHVFGDVTVNGTGDVLRNWDAIKKATKHQTSQTEVLRSVASSLPALMRAQKVRHKAAASEPFAAEDCAREAQEALEALQNGNSNGEALGKLLFAAVGLADKAGADAEEELTRACESFIGAFSAREEAARRKE